MSDKKCSGCGGVPTLINYMDEPYWYCETCETLELVEVPQ